MAHVTLSPDPRRALPWRDFDRRLFALLAHLATTARGAAAIQDVFDRAVALGDDIGDPTDAIDGLLYEERRHLRTFAVAARPARRQYAAVNGGATRYLR